MSVQTGELNVTDETTVKATGAAAGEAGEDQEHYEEVSEYRVGEGPPPLFLIVLFMFIVIWAMTSWIPFFGY